ncbi:MAG: ATP-binding protein [Thermoflexales bacterium]
MAYAAQWPMLVLGVAGLVLSLVYRGEGIDLRRIAPYQLALATVGVTVWQARFRPRLALGLCGIGAWCVAFMFAVTLQDHSALIGLALACALNVFLLGPWAGWVGGGITSVLLGSAHVWPLLNFVGPGSALAGIVGIGSSVLLAHTVWRVLLRTLCWMQVAYDEARVQARTLSDKSAELALALKSLSQTSAQMARLNEQLEVARQHADDARRSKEEFAASVSHELRAPLNLIIGFSDLILREPQVYTSTGESGSPLSPKLMADIALIHRQAQHLLKLVNDILDLSQLEANYLTVQQEVVSVNELVYRAADEYRGLLRQRGLKLVVDIAPNLPEVYADRMRVHQILLNLLSNSLRFTETGSITIRAYCRSRMSGEQVIAPPEEILDGKPSNTALPVAEVVISVADTGPGIAPENLKRVFEPFVQIGRMQDRKREGSGLGLTISKKLVELHGGQMWAESELGVGSVFSFTLPVRPAGLATLLTRTPRVLGRREVGALAVVEAVPLLSPLLSRHIRGLRVIQVEDLDALARCAETDCPEIIVVNEPASCSWQASALPPKLNHLPVIRCYVPGPIGQASQMAGVTGDFIRYYLIKPFTLEQVHCAIVTLLQSVSRTRRVAPGRPGRLLIVDSDEDTIALLSRMARSASSSSVLPKGFTGISVVKAHSSEQALALLRSYDSTDHDYAAGAIDAMLLGLELDGASSFEVLAQMDRHPIWRRIPVCLIGSQTVRGEYLATPYFAFHRREAFTVHELMEVIANFTRLVLPGVEVGVD